MTEATAEIARPTATSSSGTGWRRRWIATQPIETAATMIRPPSTPAEKYSAFSWPYMCCSSGGSVAQRTTISAISAAARLTIDSSASESRPVEPVSLHASIFKTIVAMPVATESSINRVKRRRCKCESTGGAYARSREGEARLRPRLRSRARRPRTAPVSCY